SRYGHAMRSLLLIVILAGIIAGAWFFRDQIPMVAGLLEPSGRTAGAQQRAAPGWGARDLKLCNDTSSRVGVAIGYKDAKEGWTSEGWWNVPSKSCDVLIQDKLRARYYYIYAVDYDRGGEWSGSISMCTDDNEFTIRGLDNCEG